MVPGKPALLARLEKLAGGRSFPSSSSSTQLRAPHPLQPALLLLPRMTCSDTSSSPLTRQLCTGQRRGACVLHPGSKRTLNPLQTIPEQVPAPARLVPRGQSLPAAAQRSSLGYLTSASVRRDAQLCVPSSHQPGRDKQYLPFFLCICYELTATRTSRLLSTRADGVQPLPPRSPALLGEVGWDTAARRWWNQHAEAVSHPALHRRGLNPSARPKPLSSGPALHVCTLLHAVRAGFWFFPSLEEMRELTTIAAKVQER